VIVPVHVDDIIITWNITLILHFFLGVEATWKNGDLHLTQKWLLLFAKPIVNNYWLLIQPSVCVCVKPNILNTKFKEDKIFVTKWKLCEEKNYSGAAKPRNSTIQKQS
jgi:hypothetical protein